MQSISIISISRIGITLCNNINAILRQNLISHQHKIQRATALPLFIQYLQDYYADYLLELTVISGSKDKVKYFEKSELESHIYENFK